MGRIVTQVELTNPTNNEKPFLMDAFVDTGAGALVLPSAWKDRLGKFLHEEEVELLLANNDVIAGVACGPVGIRIEGFRKIFNEVMFVPPCATFSDKLPNQPKIVDSEKVAHGMFTSPEPDQDGGYQPLLGYVILEQSQVAIDMLGHRLVPVKYIDCK